MNKASRAHRRIGARQDLHNELLRPEALALTRLPWNIKVPHGLEAFAVVHTNDTTNGLGKRVDTPEKQLGQGDMVLSLWKHTQFKVPVNNFFVKFGITPDKTVVMTTESCYVSQTSKVTSGQKVPRRMSILLSI